MSDLVPRLARAAAHGIRQKELVNELLAGEVEIVEIPIPGQWETALKIGEARVAFSSWKNLRRRLTENGFFFIYSEDRRIVRMKFSA